MKHLEQPCTRCGECRVIPPEKNKLHNRLILVRCEACGKSSRYNVVDHNDKSQAYWLSAWGRTGNGYVRQTWFVTEEQAKLPAESVRVALDRYIHSAL